MFYANLPGKSVVACDRKGDGPAPGLKPAYLKLFNAALKGRSSTGSGGNLERPPGPDIGNRLRGQPHPIC